jgi:MFS transporter, SP family, general alpha glucoside:H+ symporter
MLGAYFAPESPWCSVRRGKNEQAKQSLRRLRAVDTTSDEDIDAALAYIKHTTELEKGFQARKHLLQMAARWG